MRMTIPAPDRVAGPRWPAAAAAVLAAALNCSFLLAALTHPLPGAGGGFISGLELPGQPWAWLYRACDVAGGVATVVAALLTALALTGRRRAALACAVLGVAGLASVTDGLTTMRCAPGRAAVCAGDTLAPGAVWRELLAPHTVSGLLGLISTVAGFILLGEALSTNQRRWAALLITNGVLVSVSALGDAALMLRGADVGSCERVRTVLTSAAFLVLACWHLNGRPNRDAHADTNHALTAAT